MIHYKQDSWIGLKILCHIHGSVVPQAIPRAIISGFLCFACMHWKLVNVEQPGGGSLMWHPSVFVFFRFNATGLVEKTYRSSSLYVTPRQVQQMASYWGDAVSQYMAFDEASRMQEKTAATVDGPSWRARIIHLVSLLHAVCIQYLLHQDATGTQLEVLGGVGRQESQMLSVTDDQAYLVMHWISQQVCLRHVSGGLAVPSPILSRSWQVLSLGMLAYNQACKIEDTPFPFPYVQLLHLMDLLMTVVTPVVIASWMSALAFAVVLTMMVVGAFHAMFAAACIMETPFGRRSNDLPLLELHRDFLSRLKSIVDMSVADRLSEMIMETDIIAPASAASGTLHFRFSAPLTSAQALAQCCLAKRKRRKLSPEPSTALLGKDPGFVFKDSSQATIPETTVLKPNQKTDGTAAAGSNNAELPSEDGARVGPKEKRRKFRVFPLMRQARRQQPKRLVPQSEPCIATIGGLRVEDVGGVTRSAQATSARTHRRLLVAKDVFRHSDNLSYSPAEQQYQHMVSPEHDVPVEGSAPDNSQRLLLRLPSTTGGTDNSPVSFAGAFALQCRGGSQSEVPDEQVYVRTGVAPGLGRSAPATAQDETPKSLEFTVPLNPTQLEHDAPLEGKFRSLLRPDGEPLSGSCSPAKSPTIPQTLGSSCTYKVGQTTVHGFASSRRNGEEMEEIQRNYSNLSDSSDMFLEYNAAMRGPGSVHGGSGTSAYGLEVGRDIVEGSSEHSGPSESSYHQRPELRHQDSFPMSDVCYNSTYAAEESLEFPIRHTRSQEFLGRMTTSPYYDRTDAVPVLPRAGSSQRQFSEFRGGSARQSSGTIPTLVSCDEQLPVTVSRRISSKSRPPVPLQRLPRRIIRRTDIESR